SSPVIYKTLLLCDKAAQICSNKVDLPIPGSPPINTSEPFTMPPPSTRLNSAELVLIRGVVSCLISFSFCTFALFSRLRTPCFGLVDFCSIISSIWFQPPQLGHLPIHFGD